MIRLDGNAEVVFASHNSINCIPEVYAEWNYNSITRPYAVAPSEYLDLETGRPLKDPLEWTAVTAGSRVTIASRAGYSTYSDISTSAIKLTTGSVSDAVYKSPKITLVNEETGKWYKLVFYVKANQPVVSDAPETILSSEIDIESSANGSIPYFYRVVPVDKNGNMAPIDYDYQDVVMVESDSNANNIKLHWDHTRYRAPVYHIYRGKNTESNLKFLRSVSLKTYSVKNAAMTTSKTIEFTINGDDDGLFVGARIKLTKSSRFSRNITPAQLEKFEESEWEITSISQNSSYGAVIDPIVTASYLGSKSLPSNGNFTTSPSAPRPSLTLNSFIDNNINSVQDDLDPIPIKNDLVRLIVIPTLRNAENVLESTKYFIRVYQTDTSNPESEYGVVELDGINYKKVEVFFGSKNDFDSVQFDFDVNADYASPALFLYNPEIYQLDEWTFKSTEYYPIESVFDSHRPGEALLNPFLPEDEFVINKSSKSFKVIGTRPCSFAVFNPDALFDNLFPYKQLYDGALNNTFRYYATQRFNSQVTKNFISAKYHDPMSINKIVIKASNCFTDMTSCDGSIVLIKNDGSTTEIAFPEDSFNESGIMTMYFNGVEWSTTRPSHNTYPQKLMESGILQNVFTDVIGVIFKIDNIKLPARLGNKKYLRAHIIEISPRLELDVSGLIQSFSINKSLDDTSAAAGFPLAYINSNTANIGISNIPVYRNSFPFTIFDNMSEEATFYGLMRQNVKFTAALISPNEDFTDIIPLFCMYSDEWSVSDITTVNVNLFDATKVNLMAIQAPDYYGEDQSAFATITNIMDAAGFSDYDYDGLKKIMSRRAKATTHFWCDRNQTLFEAMQSFFLAHQIGAHFDEYGIMRFIDIDEIIDNYMDPELEPAFAITDRALEIKSGLNYIRYIPNLMPDSFETNITKKIGKVSVEYSLPTRHYSGDKNVAGMALQRQAEAAVWTEKDTSGIMMGYANKSVNSSDNRLMSDPALSTLGQKGQTPANVIFPNSGTAFLQGELVSWSGLEYRFFPFTRSASVTMTASAIVTSASPFNSTASISTTSPLASKVQIGMEAYSEQIPLKTTVTKMVVKKGTDIKFNAINDATNRNNVTTTNPAASVIKENFIITGPKYPSETFVTSVAVSGASTTLALSNRPKSGGLLQTTAYGSSTTFVLSASPTINGTASTAASVTNYSTGFSVDFSVDDSIKIANPEFNKTLRSIVLENNDINDMLIQILAQDSRITGVKYDFTGRLFGLSRGNRFTSVRNHYLVDDDLTVSGTKQRNGWVKSNVCFSKYIVSSKTGLSSLSGANVKSSIVFDNNVATFRAARNKSGISYPIVLCPTQSSDIGTYNQPTNAKNFNYFSFRFKAPNFSTRTNWGADKEIIEFGLFLQTSDGNLMIGLSNNKKKTYLKTNVDRGSTGAGDDENDMSNYVLKRIQSDEVLWSRETKGVFDGKVHRMSVVFHSTPQFDSAASGVYRYCTIILDETSYGPYLLSRYLTKNNFAIPDGFWGFYVRNVDRNFDSRGTVKTANVNLYEMYACDWWDGEVTEITRGKKRWHWQSEHFLTGLVNKNKDIEPKYYFWGPMTLRGVKFYDNVNFETSPVNTQTLKTNFAGYSPKSTATQTFKTLTNTSKKNLMFSDIGKTPFRFSMAVTHDKSELVFLSSEQAIEGTAVTALSINGRYNKLTDPRVIERVIDASSIANSIQLSTKWVQSESDAKALLNKIAMLANTFNNEVNLSIFGNPLIQVGDICQLVYSLKRIGYSPETDVIVPKYFFVKAVSHSIGTGMTTQLTLKPLFDMPE